MSGWLDALPDKWQRTRRQSGWAGGFPDVEPFGHVIDLLWEAGVVSNSGDPLGWQDLQAFGEMVQPLNPWEAKTLTEMSAAYLGGYRQGQDPASPAPWIDPAKIDHAMLAKKGAGLFESLRAIAQKEE